MCVFIAQHQRDAKTCVSALVAAVNQPHARHNTIFEIMIIAYSFHQREWKIRSCSDVCWHITVRQARKSQCKKKKGPTRVLEDKGKSTIQARNILCYMCARALCNFAQFSFPVMPLRYLRNELPIIFKIGFVPYNSLLFVILFKTFIKVRWFMYKLTSIGYYYQKNRHHEDCQH